ncbi:MAG: PIN domain-containing protein [Kiritimatiellae bacterium]|nr:PIN domain-containing protein [Kiritimatiellia bacterium]
MKTTYVLIDYENVQPETLTALERDNVNVMVFVGANQTKVTYEVASVMQRMGDRAAYVKIAGSGNNALDFHIAYYVGQLAAAHPDARFHIVSNDSGFDPLIHHLKGRKIAIDRIKQVADMHLPGGAGTASAPDRLAVAIAYLAKIGAAKPRTVKTLGSTVNALFRKELTAEEIAEIVGGLVNRGVITVNQNRVAYELPSPPPQTGQRSM